MAGSSLVKPGHMWPGPSPGHDGIGDGSMGREHRSGQDTLPTFHAVALAPAGPRVFSDRYAFTIGHLPSDSGRNASSAGVVPISLYRSHSPLLSDGCFTSNK